MKKVLLVAALVLGTIALQAQVYLTDVLKPAEEHYDFQSGYEKL